VASTCGNIGIAYKKLDDYAQALEYHEKSHRIVFSTLGPEHPNLGNCYANFSQVYVKQGDLAKAKKLYQKARAVWKRTNGENHPAYKMVQKKIGQLL